MCHNLITKKWFKIESMLSFKILPLFLFLTKYTKFFFSEWFFWVELFFFGTTWFFWWGCRFVQWPSFKNFFFCLLFMKYLFSSLFEIYDIIFSFSVFLSQIMFFGGSMSPLVIFWRQYCPFFEQNHSNSVLLPLWPWKIKGKNICYFH